MTNLHGGGNKNVWAVSSPDTWSMSPTPVNASRSVSPNPTDFRLVAFSSKEYVVADASVQNQINSLACILPTGSGQNDFGGKYPRFGIMPAETEWIASGESAPLP